MKKKEELYLGYNTMQSSESQLTLQRNISPPSSGLKLVPPKRYSPELFVVTAVRISNPTWKRNSYCATVLCNMHLHIPSVH
jgi:hypothetical protein